MVLGAINQTPARNGGRQATKRAFRKWEELLSAQSLGDLASLALGACGGEMAVVRVPSWLAQVTIYLGAGNGDGLARQRQRWYLDHKSS